MEFQHVLPMDVDGATLFGLDLDILHSNVIDSDGLRQWADTLADTFAFLDKKLKNDAATTFRNAFFSELQAFCLLIATADGPLTDNMLAAVNHLVGDRVISSNDAERILDDIGNSVWLQEYPLTFMVLVRHASQGKDIVSAGEIYYFYHQVARFIYSIEHNDDFDENSVARGYITAYKKYVERVSVLGFELPPEDQRSIRDVCGEWTNLMRIERGQLTRDMIGTWEGVSGDVLSIGDFTRIALWGDGRGRMGVRRLEWVVSTLPDSNVQAAAIQVDGINAIIIMLPLGPDRVVATVYSDNELLDLKSAIYQRDLQNASPNSPTASRAVVRTAPKESTLVQPHATSSYTGTPQVKLPWQLIALSILVFGSVIHGIATKPAKTYERASGYYESGQYELAASAFEELGNYEDSDAMLQKALEGVAAKEAEENAGENPDAWEAAAQAYEKLDNEKGETEAQDCRNHAAYYKGKKLMADGKWKKAKKAFGKITVKNFEDVPSLINECDTHVTYEEAESLLADGSYYEAYVKFNSIEDSTVEGLPDLSERAQACIQDIPETGVMYTDPNYMSTAVPLTIKNEDVNTYYKIYDGETSTLVMAIFIRPSESIDVSLPSGEYRMNEAHGKHWFGEKDMFGDEGGYYHCLFSGNELAELEWGYSYTISTSYGYPIGGSTINSEEIDKDSF